MVKLGDACDIERGGSPRPINKFITEDKNGVNWIKIGDTSEDSMYITKTKQKIIPEGMKKSRYVQPGDFLLSNSMSFGRPYILKIDGCIHDGWLVLRDKNNYFHKEYLYYSLSSKTTYEKFKRLAVGGVVNNLNSTIVKQVEIPLPPLQTQKQIAKTLDTAAELLAMCKQQLTELDNLIKSIFYEMFGDPVMNEKGWEVVIYSSIMTEKPKNGFFAKNDIYCEDGNCEVIWISDFIDKMYCSLSNLKKVKATEKDIEKYKVAYGDMLFCRSSLTRAGIGKCSYVPEKVRNNTLFECHIIKTKIDLSKINPIFLQVQTTTDYFRNQVISNSKTSTMTTIGQNGIVNNFIILPPLPLQNKFAAIVTKIEEQKALVKKAIDETQYLFDSLMSQYFD